MPTDPAPIPPPRWRIDAVAVSLGVLGILLALGLVTSPNWFGAWGDWFAGRLLDALGLGVGVLLAGWFTAVGLYVARRSWLRLGIRALGWVVLTAAASTFADKVLPVNPGVSESLATGQTPCGEVALRVPPEVVRWLSRLHSVTR